MAKPAAREIDTETDELLARVEDGVAILTLNRPKARNALTATMFRALGSCLRELRHDADIGALVLTGSGDGFCAGGDVRDMAQGGAGGEQGLAGPTQASEFEAGVRALQRMHDEVPLALHEFPVPTIAALPGAAAGAGLSLALACDLRIASERALLLTAFANVGVSGDNGASWLLTQMVGPARARELFFLSERIDAPSAERLGLLNRVVPHEKLEAEAYALAHRLAHGPRVALAYMKQNLNLALRQDFRSCLDAEAVAMRRTQMTEDHREAARAFVEKREPRFRGR